jgi:molecular chaperone GrpE (heat shock protein)
LRLEVEKLRRTESEWLQIVVRMLDHVHALHQAGVRSGQPSLREQLSHFQNACREIARRVGLVPFEANGDDPFDEKVHQLIEPDGQPLDQALVAETVAAGYTFQGQLLRRSLVRVKAAAPPSDQDQDEEPELGLESGS